MSKQVLREKINMLTSIMHEMYPVALTELEFETEFQLLVAIIMSAQATDKQVNKVNKVFFQHLKNPSDGVRLGEEFIRQHIRSISFFNNKAKNIFITSTILLEKYNGKIPRTLEELTKLAGVGIKTAKVFLSVIENASYLAVDTHVHRVLNRIGFVHTKSPLETNKEAEKIFTADDNSFLHHSIVLFGRYHCIARKPKCESCKVQEICEYYKKELKTKNMGEKEKK